MSRTPAIDDFAADYLERVIIFRANTISRVLSFLSYDKRELVREKIVYSFKRKKLIYAATEINFFCNVVSELAGDNKISTIEGKYLLDKLTGLFYHDFHDSTSFYNIGIGTHRSSTYSIRDLIVTKIIEKVYNRLQ